MVAGSFSHERKSTVSADRLWKAGVVDHELIPKLCSEHIASLELLEGDGGVGSITKLTLTPAVKAPFSYVKDKVEVMDHEKHVFKYSVVEGGLLGLRLKSYCFEIKFEGCSDGGAVGKLTVEYDTIDDTLLSEEEQGHILEGVLGMMEAVDGYLLANPTAYAN